MRIPILAPLRATAVRLQTALSGIHPVDRSLLLFMAVLLGQSAYSLFAPGSGPMADEIDIIVRTAAASIFGYFLSGSFLSCAGQSGPSPSAVSGHMLKAADIVIICTAHACFDYDRIQKCSKEIFDTRNAMKDVKDRSNIELL